MPNMVTIVGKVQHLKHFGDEGMRWTVSDPPRKSDSNDCWTNYNCVMFKAYGKAKEHIKDGVVLMFTGQIKDRKSEDGSTYTNIIVSGYQFVPGVGSGKNEKGDLPF